MVSDAVMTLTNKDTGASFLDASVSEDNLSYDDSVAVKKNGWTYIKFVAADYVKNVELEIANNADQSSEILGVDAGLKIGEVKRDDGYAEWILRTYFETAGSYSLSFIDKDTGEKSKAVYIEVSDVYTTRAFEYTVNENNTVTINSMIAVTSDIYIPDYIDGYPVTEIAPYAFNNYGLTMPGLTLRLPKHLKSIGEYAFAFCSSLSEVEFPEGLESIGAYAFTRCYLLEYVDIPDSVTHLGEKAFHYSRGVYYVKVGAGLKTVPYRGIDGLFGTRTYIFEEGVEKISNYAASEPFLCESIYLPTSITAVEKDAFRANRMYNNVTIYGVPGSYAETFAAINPSKYTFVAIANPVISGIEDGNTYDLYTEAAPSLTWDHGHIAYLNGERYIEGKPITDPGEYTLTVVNGYDEYSTTVKFTVVDTTPPPYTLGDMDNDGEISVADALAILRIVAKLAVPEGEQNLIADINKDDVIAVDDALAVLRYVAKLTDSLE